MNSLISIIIPLYNAERFLNETLDSVMKQTYENWECIIVDDGSTDSSSSLALKYCNEDNRFQYIRQANYGPSRARNHGFELSKGDYIQFLDADDVILANRFELLLEVYQKVEGDIILYTDLMVGNNENIYNISKFNSKTTLGHDIDFASMYRDFPNEILFIPGCVLFPRKSLTNIQWNEKINHAEDWDYYLQITKYNGHKFRNIPIVLFYYRNTINSLSKNLESIYKSNYYIIEKYRNFRNVLIYCEKCGMFIVRNLINYRNKKMKKIPLPFTMNLSLVLSIVLLPISLLYSVKYLFITLKK